MKVTIINKTQNAEDLLIFTKNTRLNMNAGLMEEIHNWPEDRKKAELDYMASTIKSSWEFIDVVFLIEGVTRATAQQITRTRTASYAMQSQRVVDASEIPVTNPVSSEPAKFVYEDAVWAAKAYYKRLVELNIPLEDARGVLPINVQCNLVAKYNQLGECRQKISEISKEYLRVQPIESPEALRKFILDGIGIEMTCLEGQIKDKIGETYSIADNYVHRLQ